MQNYDGNTSQLYKQPNENLAAEGEQDKWILSKTEKLVFTS